MTFRKTYLTILVLTSLFSVGQTEKIKVSKEINVVGVWNAYIPEKQKQTETWEFKSDGKFIKGDPDFLHNDTLTKYSFVDNILTITMRIDSEYKTLKFSVKKSNANLRLDFIEAKPPISQVIKTLLLTRKK